MFNRCQRPDSVKNNNGVDSLLDDQFYQILWVREDVQLNTRTLSTIFFQSASKNRNGIRIFYKIRFAISVNVRYINI
jgi:hypothetical protein